MTVAAGNGASDEAFELLRQAYSESESWKVAQLAAELLAGEYAEPSIVRNIPETVKMARAILAEARRQVAAGPVAL